MFVDQVRVHLKKAMYGFFLNASAQQAFISPRCVSSLKPGQAVRNPTAGSEGVRWRRYRSSLRILTPAAGNSCPLHRLQRRGIESVACERRPGNLSSTARRRDAGIAQPSPQYVTTRNRSFSGSRVGGVSHGLDVSGIGSGSGNAAERMPFL